MNNITPYSPISGQPPSGMTPRSGEAFFEPISGQWVGRNGEQPIADWIRSLPNTDAGLSMIDRWPGGASIDELVGRAASEALAQVRTDHVGVLPGGDVLARVGVVDAVRSESDGVRAGYALGSLAAAIEQRIAAHPGVPSDTAARFAAELRERGAAMSFGAAREATADPNVFAFRGVCYASEDAMVGAVTRAMHDPNATYVRALTPEMERAGRIAEMNRAVMNAPRSPLGTTWAETGYMIARGHGAGPEGLERAYALGATGDALLGVGGAVASAGAARTGFRAPGAQAGPLAGAGRVSAPTRTTLPGAPGPAAVQGGTTRATSPLQGERLGMQLAAEQAAGARAPARITSFSDHAESQMRGRDGGIGVSRAAVEDAFADPIRIRYQPSRYGPTFQYVGRDATVAVNVDGRVTTAWATSSTGTR